MFSKRVIKKDSRGRDVVQGKDIKEFIPEPVLPHLKASCKGYGYDWETIIEECTLYIEPDKNCTIMYQVKKWVFSGKMLLTFSLNPEFNHSVGYPNKGLFLEHTLSNYRY